LDNVILIAQTLELNVDWRLDQRRPEVIWNASPGDVDVLAAIASGRNSDVADQDQADSLCIAEALYSDTWSLRAGPQTLSKNAHVGIDKPTRFLRRKQVKR
jgi:hypothetical protein